MLIMIYINKFWYKNLNITVIKNTFVKVQLITRPTYILSINYLDISSTFTYYSKIEICHLLSNIINKA